MAGKSPEKAPREEKPTTGDSRRPRPRRRGRAHVGPTHPGHLATAGAPAGRPRARPRDSGPGARTAAPLPTVYVADTLLVRDIADPFLDAEGRESRVEELIAFAGLAAQLARAQAGRGDPVERAPPRQERLAQPGREGHRHPRAPRARPEKAGKIPDAWRFLQDALTEPSERGSLLYDKLGLGRLPDPTDSDRETDAERRRRERRDRRGRSMASGVSVEHVLTAGGGVWGGGGGSGAAAAASGAAAAASGAAAAASGAAAACSPSTAPPASAGAARSCGRHPTHALGRAHDANAPVVAVLDTGLGKHPWFPDEPEGATAESAPARAPAHTAG